MPLQLVSLTELKRHVNITTAQHDAELLSMVEAAAEIVASYCGPVVPVQITERLPYGYPAVLSKAPVLALVSATGADGLAVDLTDAIVRPGGWVEGVQLGRSTLIYTAGYSPIPRALQEACLIIAAHLWQTQRGPRNTAMPGRVADDTINVGQGYAIPNRAIELIQPYALPAMP